MTIIGSGFTKINVEKKAPVKGKININNNASIKAVEEYPLPGKSNQKGLRFTFEFFSKYEPKIGEINIEGNVILLLEAKKGEEVLANWKKDKKLPKEVMTPVLNTALTNCNIQALILSKDVGLPPPIPLPKLKTEEKS
ncbi:hypothetical protein KY342_06850 [Candidatus Woesearchaeota archaeon]|nr:hypothetical protein [Candidatus Woesearchaeota archaeon]